MWVLGTEPSTTQTREETILRVPPQVEAVDHSNALQLMHILQVLAQYQQYVRKLEWKSKCESVLTWAGDSQGAGLLILSAQ